MINSTYFGLLLTLGLFLLFNKINKRFQSPFLNPLLWTSITIMIILTTSGISYDSYNQGGSFISLFIAPATVSLAIPLYENFNALKENAKLILSTILSGVISHAMFISFFAFIFNLDNTLIATFVPKSVTTAIAIDISKNLGGIAPLTVSIVVVTGIIGAIIGPVIFKLFNVEDERVQGLSLGIASHAVGTSKAVELGKIQSVMASLGLILTGVFTVLLSPLTFWIITEVLK